ncbi:MAG: hypothetical protein B7X04_02190 [Parcubacteria group bacterium 21-54-25]|nr:MAG: hypothetical protein B7X04_02190 [Parcubacteria group bacterium 21-54-25]HQU07857.1 HlyD family efflux transporter periplasmic adaptor subunit [Candidatus Paceibacterota bacterium]
MSLLTPFRNVIARAPLWSFFGGLVLLVALGGGIHAYTARTTPAAGDTSLSNAVQVTVAPIASFSSATSSLPVIGTVTSLNQATVLSQTAGEIVSLPHALGDHVSAGEIIASFENSSQQAVVLQAQGAYEAAQVGVANAEGTSATGSHISVVQSTSVQNNAQNAFANALQSTYAALDDAIHTKADVLFSNPRTISAQLTLIVPDNKLINLLQEERRQLQTIFATIRPEVQDTASSTLDAHGTDVITAANFATQFLGNLTAAINETQPSASVSASTLAGYAASVSAGRSEVNAALSGLIAAKSAYDNAISGTQAAQNVATGGTAGAIALAKAQVKQAQGGYDAARAALEKTIVRSPVSGTIVSLPITLGDYVPTFSPVAVISNPHALYIKTAVSATDAAKLAVGDRAIINDSFPGVITFIAPARDPLTNKIEVRVGLIGSPQTLTDGETVPVVLSYRVTSTYSGPLLFVPLTAIKITPAGAEIFTVSSSSALVAHPVTIQDIADGMAALQPDVSASLRIVIDARGLSSGQSVIVGTP